MKYKVAINLLTTGVPGLDQVLGGGVPEHAGLHQAVRRKVQELLNGYIHSAWVQANIDEYILPPTLGSRSGVLGAIALAIREQSGQDSLADAFAHGARSI